MPLRMYIHVTDIDHVHERTTLQGLNIHTYTHTCRHTHTKYGRSKMHDSCCAYIHTYIHTHIHTYIHTHTHTPSMAYPRCITPAVHTYIHTHMHKYIHTYIHAYTHTYIHTHIPTMPDPRYNSRREANCAISIAPQRGETRASDRHAQKWCEEGERAKRDHQISCGYVATQGVFVCLVALTYAHVKTKKTV